MRLCLIANPNSIHTRRWVRHFADLGHDLHLIGEKTLTTQPPAGAAFHDLTQQNNAAKLRYLVWAQAVRRLVRQIQPDVLHAHQVASAGWLGAAAGFRPLLVTAWGSDLLLGAARSPVQRQLARWTLRRADYITCVSQPLLEAALALGVDRQRIELAPWGVDTTVFRPGDTSATLGVTGEAGPLVLSIRGVQPVYQPLTVAAAIPLVLARRPDARFMIRTYSADAGLLAEFRRQVAAAGAADAVAYVGDLPDDRAIADLYRQAAVVISVPSSDGAPQSVLEAMACGAAPVVSDLPSLRAWVRPEQEGLLTPVGDARALADAVVRLLDDPALHASIRAAAVRLVQQRADRRLCLARYEAIYQRLAAGQRPQPTPSVSGEKH